MHVKTMDLVKEKNVNKNSLLPFRWALITSKKKGAQWCKKRKHHIAKRIT